MSSSRNTHIFVHFPSTGEIYEDNVNYKETISQLIARMIKSLNINNPDSFHLYAIDKKCQRFKPDESCSSLFGVRCNQLILTRSELVNVDLFFENRHYNIVYEKSTPSLNFLKNTFHILQSSSSKFRPQLTKSDIKNFYFALYDPIADVIIHSSSPLNTTFVVLKRFEYIAPGYVFDFSIIKDISPKLSNCSYENAVISNFIKQFRSYHRNEHLCGIDFIEFSEKRSQFLFDSFRNKQFDKNGVSISEQINFLFSVLSLSKQPYIPSSLREMILSAMELEDDRKIFDVARTIAIYMPLSTYLVLQEIFQFFGVATIDERSWNNVSLMIAELLFESKSEDTEENYTDDIFYQIEEKYTGETPAEKEEREGEVFIKFTRFLFLYFKQIFHLNESIGRKNSIRMIKKKSKCDSKSGQKNKTKKSKKKKDNNNTDENQNSEEYGNLFDWVDADPNSSVDNKKKKEKKSSKENLNDNEYGNLFDWVDADPNASTSGQSTKESEVSDEVQNDDDDDDSSSIRDRKKKDSKNSDESQSNDLASAQSDIEKDSKRSKSEKKSKSDKKKKSNKKVESKSDDEKLALMNYAYKNDSKTESKSADEDFSNSDQNKKLKKDKSINNIENDNYSFILHEEMKSKEMITRTIDGFVDINVDDTIEFVPSESIFNLLNSLAQKEEEDIKGQDISSELNQLNSLITSIKTKLSAAGFLTQSLSQSPKNTRGQSLFY